MAPHKGHFPTLRHNRSFSCFPALLGPDQEKLSGESYNVFIAFF